MASALDLLSAAALEAGAGMEVEVDPQGAVEAAQEHSRAAAGGESDIGYPNPRVAGVKRKASSSLPPPPPPLVVEGNAGLPASLASILSSSPYDTALPTPLPEDSGIIRW